MENAMVKLAAEVSSAKPLAGEAAHLRALGGADEDGEWVEGISYWSDYMTIIDLETILSSPVRHAS